MVLSQTNPTADIIIQMCTCLAQQIYTSMADGVRCGATHVTDSLEIWQITIVHLPREIVRPGLPMTRSKSEISKK